MNREELENALKVILQVDTLSSLICSQIKKFNRMGITNKQIARAVCYFYEERYGDLSKVEQYGIGIVPSIYCEADQFYEEEKRQIQQKKNKAIEQLGKIKEVKEQLVKPQTRQFKRKEYPLDGGFE